MRPKAPKVRDKCERQVWESEGQVGDKCKIMWPKAPRVGDKCRRQGGDKYTLMRPKAPRVRDKCERQVRETRGRQVYTHAAQ